MAKTLNERLTSARSTDRINLTDLEALIADATAERDRQTGAAEHHAAEAVNLALSDDDREEADRLAQHCRRTAKAYTTAIDELQAKLEAKRNSDHRRAQEEAKAALIASRDDLASRLADRVPAILAELTGLLAEIEEMDERGGPTLESAEAIARGVPANFYVGPVPVTRLLNMKIPNFGGHGLAWPIDKQAAAFGRMYEAERQQRLAYQEKKIAEAARWSRYMVEAPRGGNPFNITTKRGPQQMYRNTVEAMMTAEGVKDAEEKGCKVTPLKDSESVGLPTAAAFVS